jgi:hypothetical protein
MAKTLAGVLAVSIAALLFAGCVTSTVPSPPATNPLRSQLCQNYEKEIARMKAQIEGAERGELKAGELERQAGYTDEALNGMAVLTWTQQLSKLTEKYLSSC